MAIHDREPVSICFTPASNATAAEAGIWTRPDFRGKRLAPTVVAAWSQREHRIKSVLFYSTTADNHASQSVARTLGLTPTAPCACFDPPRRSPCQIKVAGQVPC
ncbi:GNAT family N-acetyltransferase [Streptomyces sp. NPDC056716]|uniref:GNAT family N-acetyltransferase n=1 Tax=unclassified Streptomyces TaxID=2593676 RepID=UPI0036AC772D